MIVFKTKKHPEVVMFDNVALNLIKLMGHSEVVPGALAEDEVAAALSNLKKSVAANSQSAGGWEDDSISMSSRAKPLSELLEAALKNEEYVIWEKSLR